MTEQELITTLQDLRAGTLANTAAILYICHLLDKSDLVDIDLIADGLRGTANDLGHEGASAALTMLANTLHKRHDGATMVAGLQVINGGKDGPDAA